MKAIVTIRNEDGSYDEVGMRNRFVTNNYRTRRNLIRFGVRKVTSKAVRLELYHNHLLESEKPNQVIELEARP